MQGERGGWNEGGGGRQNEEGGGRERRGGGKGVKHRTDGSVTHLDSLTV